MDAGRNNQREKEFWVDVTNNGLHEGYGYNDLSHEVAVQAPRYATLADEISKKPLLYDRGEVRYKSAEQVGIRLAALIETVECYPGCQNLTNLGDDYVQENTSPSAEHPLFNVLSELWYLENLFARVKRIYGQRKVDSWGYIRVLGHTYREAAAMQGYSNQSTTASNTTLIDAVIEEVLKEEGKWM